MKRFFSIFAAWLVVLFLLFFFLGSWIFAGNGHYLRPLLPLALLLTGFSVIIAEQGDELDALKKRLDALEAKLAAQAPAPETAQAPDESTPTL